MRISVDPFYTCSELFIRLLLCLRIRNLISVILLICFSCPSFFNFFFCSSGFVHVLDKLSANFENYFDFETLLSLPSSRLFFSDDDCFSPLRVTAFCLCLSCQSQSSVWQGNADTDICQSKSYFV
jgi:hypothetical protein